MTYSEKLRDPRWQKLRLQVMERDKFTCRRCGESAKTLNVHHLAYQKGAAPWEYPPEELVTLCEECHAIAGDHDAALAFGRLMVSGMPVKTLRWIMRAVAFYARQEECEPDEDGGDQYAPEFLVKAALFNANQDGFSMGHSMGFDEGYSQAARLTKKPTPEAQ